MATKAHSRVTPATVIALALVALWLLIAAFPFIWTFWGSFKVQADFFSKADWMNALSGANTIKETGEEIDYDTTPALEWGRLVDEVSSEALANQIDSVMGREWD